MNYQLVDQLLSHVRGEMGYAIAIHPTSFHSPHEGYAVLLEEVDELWEEVRRKTSEQDFVAMRKEAIQIAAMALRFIHDIVRW